MDKRNIDRNKILADIFSDDPFDLLQVKSSSGSPILDDDRLLQSFTEINEFIKTHGREPDADLGNVNEYQLYTRLKGFQEEENKDDMFIICDQNDFEYMGDSLRKSDRDSGHSRPKKIETLEDIFEGDEFDLLGGDDEGLFDFKHTPKELERAASEFVAKRKVFSDFDKYKERFAEIQKDLASGKRKLAPFRQTALKESCFYVHNGILFYLEEINITQTEHRTQDGKRVRLDGRTHCIFENGTHSNMLKRSVEKILYSNGRVVRFTDEEVTRGIFNPQPINESLRSNDIASEDKTSGYLYVLKSLSQNPEIQNIVDLYKIGFTTSTVEERIKNAEKDPTYLMAPVEVIAKYKLLNLNAQKVEQFIHNHFGDSCLELDIFDGEGRRHTPREWFIVPIDKIDDAVDRIQIEIG